jgi:type I restriction enzyme, S subunit
MSWEVRKLGDIVDKIIGGGTPSKSKSEYWDGDIYWASVKDMSEGKYSLSETQDTITREGLDNSSANLINEGTLIVSTRMGLGRAFINTVPMAINQDLKAVYPNKKFVDNDFLLWNYVSQAAHIESMGNGATVKGIRLEQLKSIEIKLPPLKTQKRIADILSAYDDLIENNLKRIKLLEQAAQNIYKEWFVNLRFPGYENTPINEETGLPEGWKEVLAKEYFDFKRGIEVGSKNYVSEESDNTIPFLRVGSLGSRDKDVFTDISLVKDRILNFEDVCISMDGSIGLVGYGLIGAYSTGLRKIVAKSNKYSTGFIYGLLKSEEIQDTIRAYAKGSTILHASSSIEHLKFNDANEEISTQFNKVIDPIYSKLLNLNKQNQKLKEARDILLPRLMNRTIEV